MRQSMESVTEAPANGSPREAELDNGRRAAGVRASRVEEILLAGEAGARESGEEMVLAPVVDKMAYGLARVLVVAMRDLENHIAHETRMIGESVGRRLDTLQASVQELSGALSEQRALGLSVQEKCQQLATATATLQEHDGRQEVELAALRSETQVVATSVSGRIDTLSREMGVQQEDITAVKSTLSTISSSVATLVERLDRQADALRSMYASYAQRETVLEQLMDGLTKLRAQPAPVPAARL
jgi:methyl-accepting chemotaxis protein